MPVMHILKVFMITLWSNIITLSEIFKNYKNIIIKLIYSTISEMIYGIEITCNDYLIYNLRS